MDEHLYLVDLTGDTRHDEPALHLSAEQRAELDRRIDAADADADLSTDWKALRDQTMARLAGLA